MSLSTVESQINRALDIELSKHSLWEYEKYINPKFFKDDRPHLKLIADTLQALYEGKLLKPDGKPYKKLMMNLPPRHGKSYSLINFSQWVFGKNQEEKIIAVSYNDTLSSRFSKSVRDGIETQSIDPDIHVFSDVFTDIKIKYGDGAAQLWSLEGQHFSYLGTAPGGTVTGIGCSIGIIDDLIKNKDEAYNENKLEKDYQFYTDTFLSRLEEGAIQIILFTRWSKKDLCGRLLDLEPDDWYVLKEPVERDGIMLCDELLSYESFTDKKSKTSSEIIQANYYQEPIDLKGVLYKRFRLYEIIPQGEIKAYIDTADEGKDYLCCIIFVESYKQAYLLDVYYTQEGAEITERQTALKLVQFEVKQCLIESNNGGRSFARNVRTLMRDEFNSNRTVVKWFHQSQNKIARINSNAAWVQENVFYPTDWKLKWPEFSESITTFLRTGKNKHDDAEDALTGVCEMINEKKEAKVYG